MDSQHKYQILLDMIAENEPNGIEGNGLTKSMLESLTGQKFNYDIVGKHNSELTATYGHWVALYGFDDFYDLFTFADYNSQQEFAKSHTSRTKDPNKSHLVTRTVTRRGVPQQLQFLENDDQTKSKATDGDPTGSNEGSSDDTKEAEPEAISQLTVELAGVQLGKLAPEKQVRVTAFPTEFAIKGSKSRSASDYMLFNDAFGSTRAVVGITTGSSIGIKFVAFAPEIHFDSLMNKVILNLLRLAYYNDKGVDLKMTFDLSNEIQGALKFYGFTGVNSRMAKLTNRNLVKLYGKVVPKLHG